MKTTGVNGVHKCAGCVHYKPGWEGRPTAPVCVTCTHSWNDPQFINGLVDKRNTHAEEAERLEKLVH